ncbi:hypothetical protein K439DRAFT_1531113 [Ramaria rubella]|nr:hypothetical protein K439DRAFT_1531113 [Ramaria rubella]
MILDIQFTQAWLASEVLTETCGLSIASNVNRSDLEGITDTQANGSEKDSGVWWLIEPLRVPSVNHWSRTLSHPAPTGLMESTVAAFAHFTYKWSKNSIVLADMQSSSGTLASGKPGKIFFDHMTHSNVERYTGIGDYGEKGVCAFFEQHTCGGICAHMRSAALHDEAQSGDDSNENAEEPKEPAPQHRHSVRLCVGTE